ncbi:MAG TPA: AsmA family protein [Casimicrobiaceae bacterium]
MEGSRPLRWVAIAAAAAVALVVAAAIVAYATIDTQAIARYAAAEVTRLTGRTITARGPVTITLWPRLAVVANDVSISNPPGASRPELARATRVKGAIATWPLLRHRQVVAEGLELEGLDLVLETLPDGRGNWQIGPAETAATPQPPASGSESAGAPFRITGTFVLVNAKVAWRPPGGTPVDIAVPRLELAPQDGGRYAWRGTFDVDGMHWTLDASSGELMQSWRDRVPLDVDAKLAGGGVTLTAKGRVERRDSGPAAVLDTSFAWEAGSAQMARWSSDLAREAGRVSARVDGRDRRYALSAIAGAFGATKFDGTATIDRSGARPRIGGRLHADAVDLARERPAPVVAPAPASAAAPPASPLARFTSFDADVDFVIDRVRLPHAIDATNTRGRVVVANGKLALDPLDADIAGGRLDVHFSADAATSQMHLVADGRGIELARLLGAAGGTRNATGGVTTLAVDLKGPVPSLDRALAKVSGTIRFDIGPLRLQGAALDAGGEVVTRVFDTLNPFRRVDNATDIQCIVARLAVADGVAHAERTLAAETSRLTVSASGTIDLANRTLDLLVKPRARRLAALPSVELADLVRVTGPIAQPSVKLDSVGAAKTAITIGGAIATGGWSLLATPLLNAGDDPNPCATARAGGKIQGGAAAAPSASGGAPADPFGALRGLFKR